MPFLFIDYTNLVLKTYEERRSANQLSRLLMHPTTANIRQECLNVYNERIIRGEMEEDILRAFFGVPPIGRGFDYVIERYHADRFRPIRSFIIREVKNPALVNVELLAWLIDFKPRPLAFAQTILGTMNDPPESVEGPTKMEGVDTNVVEIKEVATNANTTENFSQGRIDNISIEGNESNSIPYTKKMPESKLRVSAAIGLIIVITLGVAYIIWQNKKPEELAFGSMNTGCMYWANDHYEKVPCEEVKGALTLSLNEEKRKSFRKITEEDTITEKSIGLIYYLKTDNKLEYFTAGGNHPVYTTRTLKVLSPYIYDKYLRKKDSSDKNALGAQNAKFILNR